MSSLVGAACSVAIVAGCSGGNPAIDAGSGSPRDDALADFVDAESVDRRPVLLSEMGAPDSFVVTVDEVDGSVSRFESWTYYDAGVQVDLIDGEILWQVEIRELPDGSLLPLDYGPDEFVMLASTTAVFAVLGDTELTKIDSASDFDVDGAELWAGEQLALAFVEDQLVYVETFAVALGDQEIAE